MSVPGLGLRHMPTRMAGIRRHRGGGRAVKRKGGDGRGRGVCARKHRKEASCCCLRCCFVVFGVVLLLKTPKKQAMPYSTGAVTAALLLLPLPQPAHHRNHQIRKTNRCSALVRGPGRQENARINKKKTTLLSKSPHFAVRRCANSSWNMMTAQRNIGRCASSLKSRGDEICDSEQGAGRETSPTRKDE